MSCSDSIKARLQEQRDSWAQEFSAVVGASLPGNISNLFNNLLNDSSSYVSNYINQAYGNLEQLALETIQQAATELVEWFTLSDEIQIALFVRLSGTLKEYLQKRQELNSRLQIVVLGLRTILQEMDPRQDDEIVRIVARSKVLLDNAVQYLKAAERGVLSTPPTAFSNFVQYASANIDAAKNIMAGGSVLDFGDNIQDIVEGLLNIPGVNLGERYEVAAKGIIEGLKELALLTTVEIPAAYLVTSLSGLNLGGLLGNNSFDSVDSKIKSTAQLIVAYPFHIATLNHLILASYGKIKRVRETAEQLRDDMESKLNTAAVNRGQYGELFINRPLWTTALSLLNTSARQDVFGNFEGVASNLIESVNTINTLIEYLAQPNYIKDINQAVERIKRTFATMIPSMFSALVNADAHTRAINYLNGILINSYALAEQDQDLITLINRVERIQSDNSVVQRAMAALSVLEGRLGSYLSEKWGLNDGTVVAAVASVLSPGVISSAGAPLFNIQHNLLGNVLDDEGLGYEDITGGLFGGLGNSITSLVECAEAQNSVLQRTNLPDGSDILSPPESTTTDVNQSLQNDLLGQTSRQANNTLVTQKYGDYSTANQIIMEQLEQGS